MLVAVQVPLAVGRAQACAIEGRSGQRTLDYGMLKQAAWESTRCNLRGGCWQPKVLALCREATNGGCPLFKESLETYMATAGTHYRTASVSPGLPPR